MFTWQPCQISTQSPTRFHMGKYCLCSTFSASVYPQKRPLVIFVTYSLDITKHSCIEPPFYKKNHMRKNKMQDCVHNITGSQILKKWLYTENRRNIKNINCNYLPMVKIQIFPPYSFFLSYIFYWINMYFLN